MTSSFQREAARSVTRHGDYPQDFGLWTSNDDNLCFTCHSGGLRSYFGQTNYTLSAHSASTSSFNGRGGPLRAMPQPARRGRFGGGYYHLHFAAGRFGVFLRGPKDRQSDIDSLAKQIIGRLK